MQAGLPHPRAMLELIKPITWFPPMWAYLCGAVSVGVWPENWWLVVLGVLLAGLSAVSVVCTILIVETKDKAMRAESEPAEPEHSLVG